MTKFVALLRGINVGGHRKVPMADLKAVVAEAGFEDVQHYVQSGNLVFSGEGETEEVTATLEAAVEARFGFPVDIVVLNADQYRAEVAACPFVDGDAPAGDREAKLLHLGFLKGAPDTAKIEALMAAYEGPEEVVLIGRTLHIYYGGGSGQSKLTSLMTEKKLGTPITARNWNTVQKLLALLAG